MKKKIKKYINLWESRCYFNGLPDQAPLRLEELKKVPSYRQICVAIMKNDNQLKTLGFSRPFCEIYHSVKRRELREKGKVKQLEIWD